MIATCRFCRHFIWPGDGVKYGVRHYAHFHCYLNAGKKIEDLQVWQIKLFPWKELHSRDMLTLAKALIEQPQKGAVL